MQTTQDCLSPITNNPKVPEPSAESGHRTNTQGESQMFQSTALLHVLLAGRAGILLRSVQFVEKKRLPICMSAEN